MPDDALWKLAEETVGSYGFRSRRITLGSQTYVLFIQQGRSDDSHEDWFVGVFAQPGRPFSAPEGVRQKFLDESDESMWEWAEQEARRHYARVVTAQE
jgi:hypothetical protein